MSQAGNSTTRTQSYNQRQQLATFQVGTALSADFEYHADGALRYAKDNTDAVKDRAYRYDQAGRLSEGFSGSEARGLSGADGVYRQTYQYDVWSNLTGRAVNRFWSGSAPFGTSYVNNREPSAGYDADGRVTRDTNGRLHTYDAAGRQTQTVETSRASSWGGLSASPASSPSTSSTTAAPDAPVQPSIPGGGYYTTTTLTITQSYDSDGQSLKRVETKVRSRPGFETETTERVDYYVRSSVLGGRVITQLDYAGQKTKTHVYVGSTEVAEQQLYGPGTQDVFWKYSNPMTGSSAEQTSAGVTKLEYDPFGLELGESNPYLLNAEPDYASMLGGSSYFSGGNPFDGQGGCDWDGMQVPCQMYEFAINSGYIQRTQQVQNPGQQPDLDHQRGFNRFAQITPFDRFDNAAQYGDSIDAWQSPLWIGGQAVDGGLGQGFFAHAPQNPAELKGEGLWKAGLDELRKRIEERDQCAKFLGGKKKALKALAKLKPSFQNLPSPVVATPNGNTFTFDPTRFTGAGMTLSALTLSSIQGAATIYTVHELNLSGATFGAFAIGHEFGHKMKSYDKQNDKDGFDSIRVGLNNEKLRAACFNEY